MQSLPIVDWADVKRNRPKFLRELHHALTNIGFLVLKNAPGLDDKVQRRLFKSARHFFESSDDVKATADISLTPYFRGWSKFKGADGVPVRDHKNRIKPPPMLAQEAFQYNAPHLPVCDPLDTSEHIYRRVFRGPNTWPDSAHFPSFRSNMRELMGKYHDLSHKLGRLMLEAIGVIDVEKSFRQYFDYDDSDSFGSLNHNLGLGCVHPEIRDFMRAEYAKLESNYTGAHIDGPPLLALLMNDTPGLQVVAGEGKWIDAPITCHPRGGHCAVPVIPGAIIVNSGGTLMHLSKGKVVATLHRVNTMLIPEGETRISMPFFLIPKMDCALNPWPIAGDGTIVKHTGYSTIKDRGVNAAINRMNVFPSCTKRWWMEEYRKLREIVRREQEVEQQATFDLAATRAHRNKLEVSKL